MVSEFVLPDGVYPVQVTDGGLDAPFWAGARENKILIQRCRDCRQFQWGPEHICHHCHSFDLEFDEVSPRGTVFSWERVWHPPHPRLAGAVPFVIVIVALDDAPAVRMVGNLVREAESDITIGARVVAEFEHHDAYSLIQWRPAATV
ncbi:Zn-ribbon domain-containing OB-fold protein [Microbacterium aurantiacum]|uniref:OB-fold domain-containing protein n=1 Tax=Microbacterium aurantiacum TaxID=162393 RepID=A0ABT8FWX4_9MICO|nr:OB-fold domain-containing protein [Microbacterium aurantiacum]MDN4465382.1 OB-fold domain-containing protein [Microbacterium aurantiacum]